MGRRKVGLLMLLIAILLTAGGMTGLAQPTGPSQPIFWSAGEQTVEVQPDGSEQIVLSKGFQGRQGDVTITGDRATYNSRTQQAILRGNVKIVQPGTSLSAPAVDFNGQSGIAITPNGAVIRDEEATIEAGYGEYYTKRRYSVFSNGVTMRDRTTTVRAQSGNYDGVERKGFFQGNVRVVNDSGTLNSQTLTYWRASGESYATGDVRFFSINDSTLIEADILRNRPNVETIALGNVRLYSYRDSTLLTTDTLRHRPDVETYAIGNVVLVSEPDRATLTGDTLRNFPAAEHTIATGTPRLQQIDSTLTLVDPSDEDEDEPTEVIDLTTDPPDTIRRNDSSIVPKPALDTIQIGDSLYTVRYDTTDFTADRIERFALDRKEFVGIGNAYIGRHNIEGWETEAVAGIMRFYQDDEVIALGPGESDQADSTRSDSTESGSEDVTSSDDDVIDIGEANQPDDGYRPDGDYPSEENPDPESQSDGSGTGSDGVAGEPPALQEPAPVRYTTPIVWYEKSQMTGDTITMFMEEKKVRQVDIVGDAFSISEAAAVNRYDQLAAERILVNVSQDTIRDIHAEGAAASIYFIFEGSRPKGVRRTSGDTIVILFRNGKVNRVGIYGPLSGAEGEIVPESRLRGQETVYRLTGFALHKRPSVIQAERVAREKKKTETTLPNTSTEENVDGSGSESTDESANSSDSNQPDEGLNNDGSIPNDTRSSPDGADEPQ